MAPTITRASSIADLWDEVKKAFRHLDTEPYKLTLLENAIHQAWSRITQTSSQHFVESVTRETKPALKTKFGPKNNYSVGHNKLKSFKYFFIDYSACKI